MIHHLFKYRIPSTFAGPTVQRYWTHHAFAVFPWTDDTQRWKTLVQMKNKSKIKKQIKTNQKTNQIKKYRSKPDLYREEKIRTPYINPSQIKTTGILVEFDWQKGIIQTNNIAYLEWVAINECHFVTTLSSGIKEAARWTITDNTLHFNSQMRQYFKNNKRCHSSFLFFHLLRKFITNSNRVPLASGL